MAFLEINGWTIPVASCKQKHQLLGGRGRAYDGTPQMQDRGRKRIFECKTPPLTEQAREAIIGLINGDGYVFPYSADLYSHKGWGPKTAAVTATVTESTAADGDRVAAMDYRFSATPAAPQPYSPTRSGQLEVNPATTNLLGADSRDAENATTGYSTVGGSSLAADTTNYWQGTKSVKVTTSSSGQGVQTTAIDPGAGSANKVYVGSVYVKPLDSMPFKDLRITMVDGTNAATNTVKTAMSGYDGTWVRLTGYITIGGVDCRSLTMQVVTDDASTPDFCCDGFQIEESVYTDHPEARFATAWVDGTRAAGDLAYDLSFCNTVVDWSIGAWFYVGPQWLSELNPTTLIKCVGTDDTEIHIERSTGVNDRLSFTIQDGDGTSYTLSSDIVFGGYKWNFIGVSYRRDPETGEDHMALVQASADDEEYVTEAASSVDFAFDALDTMYVGHNNESEYWLGPIGNLMFFPFAVPEDMWTGIWSDLAGEGTGGSDDRDLPQWPRKYVRGDAMINYSSGDNLAYAALFEGQVTGVDMMVGRVSGAMRTNLGAVSFTLEEV